MTICLITGQPTHCRVQNCRLKDRCDVLNAMKQLDLVSYGMMFEREQDVAER
jgi:hypothetical protein